MLTRLIDVSEFTLSKRFVDNQLLQRLARYSYRPTKADYRHCSFADKTIEETAADPELLTSFLGAKQ